VKKTLIPLFSLVLAFSLLFSVTGTAAALPPPPPPPIPTTPSLPDPVVTPVSGDMEFTTEFIPIAQFPGTTEFNQMLVPVGFPAGEAQYQGDGVVVSGMDSGKATACFTITGTEYGWGGKVGLWNGTKWVKLATTITPLEESPNSLACATITGNGTYVFIRFVADASLLPVASIITDLPTCSSIGVRWDSRTLNGDSNFSPYWVKLYDFDITYPTLPNALIQYYITNSNAPFTGDLHGSVISDGSGYAVFSGFSWRYDGDSLTSLIFTIHVVTPVCYDDFVYDWTFALPSSGS
jgi:hypothetical protein